MALGIPFANPKPLGWGLFEVLTSSQMTQVNANAAAAADGSTWSDAAIVKNWNFTDGSGAVGPALFDSNRLERIIKDPVSRRWIAFGGFGGVDISYWSVTGKIWTYTGALNGGTLTGQVACWANNAGTILAGGSPASSTANKLVVSLNGSDSWTPRAIGNANTQSVASMVYSESLALWFVTIGGAVSHDGIYSNPDPQVGGSSVWTNRYAGAPNTFFTTRDVISPIVLGTNLQILSPDGLSGIRSVDGISWPFVTFPEGFFNEGCWSTYWGKFFFGGASGIWTSTDATTGSWTKVSSENGSAPIAAFGRMLLKGDGRCSVDGGNNWFTVVETPTAINRLYAAQDAFAMASTAGRYLYLSQQVGF